MAGKGAGAIFAVAVVAAVGGVVIMVRGSGADGTPVPPAATNPPAKTPPAPKPPVKGPLDRPSKPEKSSKKRPPKPAEPPEPPIPSTPEGCLAFLKGTAGTARLPEGKKQMNPLDEVRGAALEAFSILDPAAAEPALLQALGGDGDANDWSSWRLRAAEIRIRAGKPDGAEAVKAYAASEFDVAVSEGVAAAARAASWMAPDEGAAVLRRLLAAGFDAVDDEDLVAILQAAATLGKGPTPAEMKKVFAEESSHEATVLGAAAGALIRLGDASGKKELDRIEREDEWTFDGEQFALGLGARGNDAVIPWLEHMLAVDDVSTRAGAVRALALVGTPATTALLRQALKDEDEDVSGEAAVGLALRGEKDVLPLVRKASRSPLDELAVRAWRALALAADAESKAAAEKILGEPSPGLMDPRRGPAMLRRVEAALLILRVTK